MTPAAPVLPPEVPAARIIARHYAQFRDFCRVNQLEDGHDALRISRVEHLYALPRRTKVYALSGACVPTTFRGIVSFRELHLVHLSLPETDGTIRFTAAGPTPLPGIPPV